MSRSGGIAHLTFLALLVLNLISAFHAFGTLLGIGIIIVPAASARFWTRDISAMIVLAMAGALLSGWIGLLFAFHAGIPSGPAVTLVAGVLYAGSVLFGRDRRPGLAAIPRPPSGSLVLHHPERGEQLPLVGDVLVQALRKARAVGEIIARLERVLDDALERLGVARRDAGRFRASA